MKTQNTHYFIPSMLVDFQKELGGVIENGQDTHVLHLDSSKGEGYIRYTVLQSGINAVDIVFTPKETNSLLLRSQAKELFVFLFSISGESYHQFEASDQKLDIIPHVSLLAHYPENSIGKLVLQKGVQIQINTIIVEKNKYSSEKDSRSNVFVQNLYNSAKHIGETVTYCYEGGFNPEISEQVALLMTNQHTSTLANSLLHLGRYYVIIAKHIEQFLIDTNANISTLLKKELKSINELSELIKGAPELPHTIKSLCLSSGLSPAKLQEGFKFIFERTVTDYVRHVRLRKAEYLITSTDMTISEIVYTVGLTSRSYFCKIFRNAYKCSPTEYKKSVEISYQERKVLN